jgi:DHA1 family bicyclomycin/chloramphenicol resistance-like MFS transporter
LLLAALASLQPLALNALAPAAADAARSLEVGYADVQVTFSVYLGAVAAAQLAAGQASDAWGRRPVLLAAVACYVAGSTLGVLAGSLETLALARMLQGAGGGAAFALVRTVVRDTCERDEAASRIGFLTSATLVVPLLSPALGGLTADVAGWRAIFGATAVVGLLALGAAVALLGETRAPLARNGGLRATFGAYPELLASGSFLAYTAALTGVSASFFCFMAAAPFVMTEVLGGSGASFGAWAAVLALGYFAGNTLSGRYARAIGSERLVLAGTALSVLATGVQGALVLASGWSAPVLFLPMLLASAGNGLTLPGAIAMALSARPDRAGAASGLFGALQLAASALLSLVAAAAVVRSPAALPVVLLSCNVAALAAAMLGLRTASRRASPVP